MSETWREVIGVDGYDVSDHGRVGNGETQSVVAREYGVHPSHVSKIFSGMKRRNATGRVLRRGSSEIGALGPLEAVSAL